MCESAEMIGFGMRRSYTDPPARRRLLRFLLRHEVPLRHVAPGAPVLAGLVLVLRSAVPVDRDARSRRRHFGLVPIELVADAGEEPVLAAGALEIVGNAVVVHRVERDAAVPAAAVEQMI